MISFWSTVMIHVSSEHRGKKVLVNTSFPDNHKEKKHAAERNVEFVVNTAQKSLG